MLAFSSLLVLGGLASAEPTPPAEPPGPAVVTIPLRAAVEPRPALRHLILPERISLVAGNAAPFYHRANLLMVIRQGTERSLPPPAGGPPPRRTDQLVADWVDLPLADLPRAEVRQTLDSLEPTIHEVEEGARRDRCDWELASRRAEGIRLLLPEIQQIRDPARAVELKARLAIAEGRLDDALGSIRVGFTLGRHVADGPYLIQHMVGIAIEQRMASCLEAVMAAPGAPSLCWALADRPRPLVDLRIGFEVERHLLETEVPGLDQLDAGPWGLSQARRFADTLQTKLYELNKGETIAGTDLAIPTDLAPDLRRLALAAICARSAPEARRTLVAAGMADATVAAMPTVQVSSLAAYRNYRERLDATLKWANVPYLASVGRFQTPTLDPPAAQADPLLALMSVLNSGVVDSARFAAVRVDRHLDALQVVEAIRLDASMHGGQLPASLDAIRDWPVPPDPATGRPFEYRVAGDAATVAAHDPAGGPDTPSNSLQIRLVPPGR